MRFYAHIKRFVSNLCQTVLWCFARRILSMAKHTQIVAGSAGIRLYSRHDKFCNGSASHLKCNCKKWISYVGLRKDGTEGRIRESLDTRSYTEALLLAEKRGKQLSGVAVATPEQISVAAAVKEWLDAR